MEEYNRRIEYFISDASNNFKLLYNNKEEMKTAGYYFENNYGISPYVVIVLGFFIPENYPSKNLQLIYDDVLFSNGIIKVTIDQSDIAAIPNLQFL